jgi:hypothetical protein
MRTPVVAAALVTALTIPAGASAEVVPQKSIMGIELQMTRAQVQAVAGTPDSSRRRSHEILGSYRELRYGKTTVGLGRGSGVFFVSTTARRQRTAEGVGIGTRKRVLRKRLSGERCRNRFGVHHCFFGRFRPGRTVTDFRLNKRNKVSRIVLGTVID